MTSAEIRQAFLDFFHELHHAVVPSSPLPIPDNPTLLFTNAGMNQFADVFLGKDRRGYSRAVTAQKCMRVSGKHNDLENVGPSPRHHTFFEMLGNFSFGDYFKADAIDYAWTFLTQVIGLAPQRLWATIYLDDDEAFQLWQKYLPADRIRRFGKKDNFWEMGEVGPCGPCSEIHYYVGEDLSQMDPTRLNADDDESFLEVWNLVFMQFEKNQAGEITPLPRPSIDTGMGLERITRIVQGQPSNYETDLFQPAIQRVQALLGHSAVEREAHHIAYRVIADHGRAATFLIGDGVLPGASGGPYVLRMIIRRAARFGRKLGFSQPFLAEVAQAYIEALGEAYPELRRRAAFIRQTVTLEEERFLRTLENTLERLENICEQLRAEGKQEIPGQAAFDLYATHGLPLEITRDVATEQGLTVDEAGFRAAQAAHAAASGAGAFGQYTTEPDLYLELLESLIAGGQLSPAGVAYDPYSRHRLTAPLVALIHNQQVVDQAPLGAQVEVVTAATPFYIEAGGEVSDSGMINLPDGRVRVDDVRQPTAGLIVHLGEVVEGQVTAGQPAELVVDNERRNDIRRNHTATHLLHRELRAQLGVQVTQQGSLVAPDRLRFDFSYAQAVTREQLQRLETAINAAILANYPVQIEHMGQREAIEAGAMALFGEKYGEVVRTVQIMEDGAGRYSFELCGGLHVNRTGDIGSFYFTYEGSAAAGVRRVEAVTGRGALTFVTDKRHTLRTLEERLKAQPGEALAKVEHLLSEHKAIQREIELVRRQLLKSQFETLLQQAENLNGALLLVGQVAGAGADQLREMADWFRDRTRSGAAVLGSVQEERPLFVAAVSDDLIKRGVKAGDLVRLMGQVTGGGGGGRPNLAQAGGKDATRLAEALALAAAQVRQTLAG